MPALGVVYTNDAVSAVATLTSYQHLLGHGNLLSLACQLMGSVTLAS